MRKSSRGTRLTPKAYNSKVAKARNRKKALDRNVVHPLTKKSLRTRKSKQSKDEDTPEVAVKDEGMTKVEKVIPKAGSPQPAKRKRKRDSASSDEERWLTAIESGKLEDVDDELKKIKPRDPALMTARQRAMYDRGATASPTMLMSLPTGYKEKVMTAEALEKAALKSQKRKQLANEKREKVKKRTMERLLKKQESKASKTTPKKIEIPEIPKIVFKENENCTELYIPLGINHPLIDGTFGQKKALPTPVLCVMGCGNLRKYECSQTNRPLCSLQCYKANLENRISDATCADITSF